MTSSFILPVRPATTIYVLLYCTVTSTVESILYIVCDRSGKWEMENGSSDFDCRDCHQLLFLLLHVALDNIYTMYTVCVLAFTLRIHKNLL